MKDLPGCWRLAPVSVTSKSATAWCCIGALVQDPESASRYRWRGKELNAGWVTTFNQHAVVSETAAQPFPQEPILMQPLCSAAL